MELAFALNRFEQTPFHNRKYSDLPREIRGRAQWKDKLHIKESCYTITDPYRTERPVEYINNHWYLIFWSNGLWWTAKNDLNEDLEKAGLGIPERPYLTSPDIRRLKLEAAESQSDKTEQDSTEATEEFSRAAELGLPLATIEEELESLSLTPKETHFMTYTQTESYAAKLMAALVPDAPAATMMDDQPKSITIVAGGTVPESGNLQGTSGMAIGRSQSRGKASRRIGPGIVQASGGQASGSQTITRAIIQSSGGSSQGMWASRSGTGGGQTGGSTAGTGQVGGNLPAGGPPAGPPAELPVGPPAGLPAGPPEGLPGGPPGGAGGAGSGGGPPPAAPAAAAGQAGPVPAGNGALKGHPPEVFDGNRSKAKKFMKEFTL